MPYMPPFQAPQNNPMDQFAPADIRAAIARQRLMMMALKAMQDQGYQSPTMPYSLGQSNLGGLNESYRQMAAEDPTIGAPRFAYLNK